jgi:hypothetical protein
VAVTVSEAGEDGVAAPFAGEMLSQEPPEEVVALAVKVREPPPVLDTCNCCVRAPVPWAAAKPTFRVSIPNAAGVPGWTVSVTATVIVEGTALGAVMVTVPWYLPAARFVGSVLTDKTEGKDPVEGLALSQAALVEAVKESPAIGEERLMVCVPGAPPPALAEKLKLVGVAWNVTGDPAGRTSRTRSLLRSAM